VNLVVLAGVVPVPFGGLFLPHPEPFCHPRDAPHGRFAAAPRRRWARGRGRVSSRPTGSFRHALCRTTRCPRGLKTRLASYVKPSREVLLAHLRQISALLDRHSHREQSAIREAIHEADSEASIYLFGSRVDEAAKGGDIDLLVLSRKINLMAKLGILARLHQQLGERKIDLVVYPDTSRPFPRMVMEEGVRL
jgi:predicted nucleotidyltransferase